LENTHKAGTFATIDDGYNEKGFIRERPGMYPDIRFVFRRATGEEAQVFMKRIGDISNNIARDKVGAEFLAKHVSSWDIEHQKGHIVPLNNETIMNVIKPEIFIELLSIVQGAQASDIDPQWSDEYISGIMKEDAEAELEAIERLDNSEEDSDEDSDSESRPITEMEKSIVKSDLDIKN